MDKNIEMENWKTETSKEYHRKQYVEPKRSTVAFNAFLEKQGCMAKPARILDLGCGGGLTTPT